MRQLVRLAVREDLDRWHDWTTLALVDAAAQGSATICARERGVVAGVAGAGSVLTEYDPRAVWTPLLKDGSAVERGTPIARMSGSARSLLTAERPVLNLLGHLSGIATLTNRFVSEIASYSARLYDTRKTLLGWRRLEKFAVRAGGGHNHRAGLYDGILIKDNHLAFGAEQQSAANFTPAAAVDRARSFLAQLPTDAKPESLLIEVEVDTLEQLYAVAPAAPEIVLLDNMTCEQLRTAVAWRDAHAPTLELEASGGVTLATVAAIAATGVDRISVGALTHSAIGLDVGLDWD